MHWRQVEKMARDYLERGTYDGGVVKLVMP
jgi:hypothetical protein